MKRGVAVKEEHREQGHSSVTGLVRLDQMAFWNTELQLKEEVREEIK